MAAVDVAASSVPAALLAVVGGAAPVELAYSVAVQASTGAGEEAGPVAEAVAAWDVAFCHLALVRQLRVQIRRRVLTIVSSSSWATTPNPIPQPTQRRIYIRYQDQSRLAGEIIRRATDALCLGFVSSGHESV